MNHTFDDMIFEEYKSPGRNQTIIKSENANISGKIKFSIEADDQKGVKVIIKKDAEDNIKELKFLCKCGESKSIILDYDPQTGAEGDK
ncbi:MAG TPA: hypothetical protein VMT35_14605 [Ignavibacteriaceae bacterium]|jgi:hypothetical protein|nr:hypothetical protein [Ignavibacteriaceae bacterium]